MDEASARKVTQVAVAPDGGPLTLSEISGEHVIVRRPGELPRSVQPTPGLLIAGKYRLIRQLSQGGMGCVWVAHHEVLDHQVAVKLLGGGEEYAQDIAQRMQIEAQLSARLSHPNIINVFDLGFTNDNDPYIVMELLAGEDLRTRLDRCERMTPVEAVRTLLPILEALAHTHKAGVMHRDLKPENIFLAELAERGEPLPKLLDFGIARSISSPNAPSAAALRAARPPMSSRTRRLTAEGAILGTVNYLSPEQARGDNDVDQRADIWAFTAVLYECIVGQSPFPGDDSLRVLRAIIEGSPPSPTLQGYGDPELANIVARGLTRDREQRFQSAEELGQALSQWLSDRRVPEDICGSSLRTRWFGISPHVPPATKPAPLSVSGLLAWARARLPDTRSTRVVLASSAAALVGIAVLGAGDALGGERPPLLMRAGSIHTAVQQPDPVPNSADDGNDAAEGTTRTPNEAAEANSRAGATAATPTPPVRLGAQVTKPSIDPVLGF